MLNIFLNSFLSCLQGISQQPFKLDIAHPIGMVQLYVPVNLAFASHQTFWILQGGALHAVKIDVLVLGSDDKDQVFIAAPKSISHVFPFAFYSWFWENIQNQVLQLNGDLQDFRLQFRKFVLKVYSFHGVRVAVFEGVESGVGGQVEGKP